MLQTYPTWLLGVRPPVAAEISVRVSGNDRTVSDQLIATPARLELRPAPPGMPDPSIQPPTVAESGDPFTALRIVDLLARIERGRPVRLDDIVDALNAAYLDWFFSGRVVVDVALQLQANWMADYRNANGIELGEGAYGPTLTIEDSSRVDPWFVGQAGRLADECHERLVAFSRLDRVTGDG